MENSVKFRKNSFKTKLVSMLKVDFRRLLKSRLFYIMVGIAFVVPILIVVMISMMEGSPVNDQYGNPLLDEFGNPVLMEGFKNAWQSIGQKSDEAMGGGAMAGGAAGAMDITSMCNINLVFFAISVFICLFVADDFRSGYAKNLFTVRSKKSDYIISKTVVGFLVGTAMLLAYFIGSVLGGAITSLPFEVEGVTMANIFMCMMAKIFLMGVFTSIFVLISVVAKQRAWLSICISLGGGMLLFMMIPMITPLDSTIVNVLLSLVGGIIFSVGLGAISNLILSKNNIL